MEARLCLHGTNVASPCQRLTFALAHTPECTPASVCCDGVTHAQHLTLKYTCNDAVIAGAGVQLPCSPRLHSLTSVPTPSHPRLVCTAGTAQLKSEPTQLRLCSQGSLLVPASSRCQVLWEVRLHIHLWWTCGARRRKQMLPCCSGMQFWPCTDGHGYGLGLQACRGGRLLIMCVFCTDSWEGRWGIRYTLCSMCACPR